MRLRRNEVERYPGEGIGGQFVGRKGGKGRERRRLVVSLRNDLRACSALLFPTLRGETESSTTCPTMRTAATPGGGP